MIFYKRMFIADDEKSFKTYFTRRLRYVHDFCIAKVTETYSCIKLQMIMKKEQNLFASDARYFHQMRCIDAISELK